MRGEYSTKQREVILAYLKENNAHVTASDVIFHLKEEGCVVSTATVYRTLEKLEKDGVVKKMIIGEGTGACYQYIDGDGCSEHFHLKCVKCGRLIHLSCEFLHSMESHIFNEHGFTVSSGRTIIYGTCAQCSNAPIKESCHCGCHSKKIN
ncbi:MAG: transcriptional repressor [Ruminococcaceae bacterium]|nr:transcriptional repressor [Oscillospiraceae bacterium]